MAQKLISRINQRAHYSKMRTDLRWRSWSNWLLNAWMKRGILSGRSKGADAGASDADCEMEWKRWDAGKECHSGWCQHCPDSSCAQLYRGKFPREHPDWRTCGCVPHQWDTSAPYFQESMRMPPVEYINWVRIRAACKELRKTNASVSDIALHCGFTTISTFNRNFRKILGVSPQQWRRAPEHYEQNLLKFDIKTQEGWWNKVKISIDSWKCIG